MQVRVWNDNEYDFKQDYRETPIAIPAKKFVLMDKEDADNFIGMACVMKRTPDGGPDPKYYKMLRIESLEKEAMIVSYKCNICPGAEFHDEKALVKHSLSDHSSQIFTGNPNATPAKQLQSYDEGETHEQPDNH